MQIDLEPGDFVVNPDNREWGIGQIQSIIKNKITVNFQNNGKQVLNTDYVNLEKAKMLLQRPQKLGKNKEIQDLRDIFGPRTYAQFTLAWKTFFAELRAIELAK